MTADCSRRWAPTRARGWPLPGARRVAVRVARRRSASRPSAPSFSA